MGKLALPSYLSRVSTRSFIVLIIRNLKSNHSGAQGTVNPHINKAFAEAAAARGVGGGGGGGG